MSRLEGSRWRLRWAREMPLAMEFEWGFFRPLFGAKRACGHFQECGGERQIPPHAWRIISRAASAAPAASCLSAIRKLSQRPVVTNGHRIGYSPSCKGRFYECFSVLHETASNAVPAQLPVTPASQCGSLEEIGESLQGRGFRQPRTSHPRRIKEALSP